MSEIQIELAPGTGISDRIVIDGKDLANWTRGFTLKARAGEIPQLIVDLLVVDMTKVGAEKVEVYLDEETAKLLQSAGWTPPPGVRSELERDKDGCPCEWKQVGWPSDDPDKQETILGRIVPTCPVHGGKR